MFDARVKRSALWPFALLAAFAVIAGSAFAQVSGRPPGARVRDQIQLEMKLIEHADGVLGVSLEKGKESALRLTPEEFQEEMEKVAKIKGVDILGAPKVVTRDGQRCVIDVGNPDAKPKAGYAINVLPRIGSEGIVLDILFNYCRPGAAGKKDDALRATLATSVTVIDGGTVLLAGMGTKNGRGLTLAVTASRIAEPPTEIVPADEPAKKATPQKE